MHNSKDLSTLSPPPVDPTFSTKLRRTRPRHAAARRPTRHSGDAAPRRGAGGGARGGGARGAGAGGVGRGVAGVGGFLREPMRKKLAEMRNVLD